MALTLLASFNSLFWLCLRVFWFLFIFLTKLTFVSVNQVDEQEAERHSVKPNHGLRGCAMSSAVINLSALSGSNGFWEWRKDREMEEEGERATTRMEWFVCGCVRAHREVWQEVVSTCWRCSDCTGQGLSPDFQPRCWSLIKTKVVKRNYKLPNSDANVIFIKQKKIKST